MDLRIEQTFVQAETGEQFEGDKKEKGMRAAEAECPRNTAAHERVKIHDGADGDGRQYAEDIEAGQGCGEPDSKNVPRVPLLCAGACVGRAAFAGCSRPRKTASMSASAAVSSPTVAGNFFASPPKSVAPATNKSASAQITPGSQTRLATCCMVNNLVI